MNYFSIMMSNVNVSTCSKHLVVIVYVNCGDLESEGRTLPCERCSVSCLKLLIYHRFSFPCVCWHWVRSDGWGVCRVKCEDGDDVMVSWGVIVGRLWVEEGDWVAWSNSSLPDSAVGSKNNNCRGIRGSERYSAKKVCSCSWLGIILQ